MRKKCPINRKSLESVRVQAVQARKRGARVCDIANALGVHPNSVSRWVGQYNAGGARALRSTKSSGRPRKIDCRDLFPKIKRIVSRDATSFGFDTPLWTIPRLQKVLKSELDLKLSRATLHRRLTEIGLSFQKPEKRAFQQDPNRRKIWLKKEWPKLQKRATKQRAVILFLDECSVSLNPNSGKTWARIGRTPHIKTSSSKGSIGIISAIAKSGKLYFTIPSGRVNSHEFIKFLKKILKQISRKKIIIVLDNCSSHKSNKTFAFIEEHPRLQLHFLPPYSPDFNPDEHIWSQLKGKLNGHQATNKTDLRAAALRKMRSIQKKKGMLKNIAKKKI